jgi:cytochrome c556
MAERGSKEFAKRIAEAADKIWEVGKRWEQHPDDFSWNMKNLSSKLHTIRCEFEGGRELGSVAETERSKIWRIAEDVYREVRKTGGSCGKLLAEAHEILVGLVEDLKTVE